MRPIDADALKEKLRKDTNVNSPTWAYNKMQIAFLMMDLLDKEPTLPGYIEEPTESSE